jgi:hypothetical protein
VPFFAAPKEHRENHQAEAEAHLDPHNDVGGLMTHEAGLRLACDAPAKHYRQQHRIRSKELGYGDSSHQSRIDAYVRSISTKIHSTDPELWGRDARHVFLNPIE